MTDDSGATDDLLRRAKDGDEPALADLFARHRDRLQRMIRLSLDRRLLGRLDSSDVLQEAYLDVLRRFPEYAAKLPCRSSSGSGAWRASGSSTCIVATSAPRCAAPTRKNRCTGARFHRFRRPRWPTNFLDTSPRPPVPPSGPRCRSAEDLSDAETAEVLNIQECAAGKRYIRALRRLKTLLDGFSDSF